VGLDWVHLVCWPLTGLLYQPQMIDECRAVGRMRICRGNQSTQRKHAPVPIWPSQIPHDLTWARTWARTWATMVGSQRLTTWAMAHTFHYYLTAYLMIWFMCSLHLKNKYCDVDSASLGKHPPPAVFLHALPRRAEVSRAEAHWLLRSSKQLWQHCLTRAVNTLPREAVTSCNSRTTVARQAVNMTLLNSGAYYVAVLCVIRPEAK
jgi:hypothetical protein